MGDDREMSKERLEEINQRILDIKRKSGMPNEVLTWSGWQSTLPIFTKDLEYLQEKAERVQELESNLELSHLNNKLWVKENKQYREVIEKLYKFDGNVEEHSALADMLCGELLHVEALESEE